MLQMGILYRESHQADIVELDVDDWRTVAGEKFAEDGAARKEEANGSFCICGEKLLGRTP